MKCSRISKSDIKQNLKNIPMKKKKGKVVKAIVTRVVAWYPMSVTYGGGGGEDLLR